MSAGRPLQDLSKGFLVVYTVLSGYGRHNNASLISTTQATSVFTVVEPFSAPFSRYGSLSPSLLVPPEGILAFRTLPLSRAENKIFHNVCMFTAVVLVSLGMYAVFQVCCLSITQCVDTPSTFSFFCLPSLYVTSYVVCKCAVVVRKTDWRMSPSKSSFCADTQFPSQRQYSGVSR